jgi:hypothetical protein
MIGALTMCRNGSTARTSPAAFRYQQPTAGFFEIRIKEQAAVASCTSETSATISRALMTKYREGPLFRNSRDLPRTNYASLSQLTRIWRHHEFVYTQRVHLGKLLRDLFQSHLLVGFSHSDFVR